MKHALLAIALLAATSAFANDTSVNGYFRKDGSYVAPHHRTAPDNTRANNYGSQGMVNPYSGQMGTINPYAPQPVTPPVFNPYANPYNGRR